MKKKTIGKIISGKVQRWVATIQDEKLRKDVEKSVVVTGGAITSLLLGDSPTDYDVYLDDKEVARRLAQYYVAAFKANNTNCYDCEVKDGDEPSDNGISVFIHSAGVASIDSIAADGEEASDYQDDAEGVVAADESEEAFGVVFISQNAITLSGGIQVVLRFCGSPDALHANYDFVHCTNYWTAAEGVVLKQEALEAILAKELVYIGSKFPICSVMRLRKFIARGWTINAGQVLKMCMQISELDLTDPRVLQRQLTGVDAAYFAQLIDLVKADHPEKVDAAYLCEIIDRIWG